MRPYDGLSDAATAALRGIAWPQQVQKKVRMDGGGAVGAALRRHCEQTPGCVAVNSNGWMKSTASTGMMTSQKDMSVWIRSKGPPLPHDYVLRTLLSLQREVAAAAQDGAVDAMGQVDDTAGRRCTEASSLLALSAMDGEDGTPSAGSPGRLRGSQPAEPASGAPKPISWSQAIARYPTLLPPSAVADLDGTSMGGGHLLEATVATVPGDSDYAAQVQVPADVHAGVAARLKDTVLGPSGEQSALLAAELAVAGALSVAMGRAVAGTKPSAACVDHARLLFGHGAGDPLSLDQNQTADAAVSAARNAVHSAGDGRAAAASTLPPVSGELEHLAARGKVHVFVINTSPPLGRIETAASKELALYRKEKNKDIGGTTEQRAMGKRRRQPLQGVAQSDYPAFELLRSLPGLADDPRVTIIDATEVERRVEAMPPPHQWGQPPPSKKKKVPPRGEINQNLQLADVIDDVYKRAGVQRQGSEG